MNKVKRIVFALLFALAAVPLSAQEKPEAGNGYIFRFVADKDMFFSPWSGNGKELERLLAAIEEHRTERGFVTVLRSSGAWHVLKLVDTRDGVKAKLAGAPVEQTHVRHILMIVSDISPESEVVSKLNAIKHRIESGQSDFATMARLTSVDNSATRGWGTAGKNGAQVTFTADAQTLDGDIEVDSISTLDLTLKNSSTFTGTINIVDNADGGTAVENNAVVTIEKGSKWVLTGDCTITSLTNNGTIDFNGHTITLADGTVLKG